MLANTILDKRRLMTVHQIHEPCYLSVGVKKE
jgi:hypothetical protein